MKIRVGHPVYSGANAMKIHGTTHGAVMDLIRRGVDRKVARAKVTELVTSYPASHITMMTANRAEVIELVLMEEWPPASIYARFASK